MVGDLKVIDELEREFGMKVPRASVGEAIPVVSRLSRLLGNKLSSFHQFHRYPAMGCFADSNGNVVGLALCGQRLEKFPQSILKLKELRRLNLGWNRLATLPDEIQDLNSLEALYLVGNKMLSFPTSILKLKNLQDLNLSHNRLTFVPDEIADVKSLERVDLRANRIESLPRSMFNMGLDICLGYAPRGILVGLNPLRFPPRRVIMGGAGAVAAYFARR